MVGYIPYLVKRQLPPRASCVGIAVAHFHYILDAEIQNIGVGAIHLEHWDTISIRHAIFCEAGNVLLERNGDGAVLDTEWAA